MSQEVITVIQAIVWSILATSLSQVISVGIMSWLGLPPKKLANEINTVQNPAVGASFFIISLAVGLFVGILTSNGFTEIRDADYLGGGFWIILALVMGTVLMWLSFVIAHRVLGVESNESTKRYIQRELIEEQNVALAFFLGGLAIVPYIAVIFQVI